MYICNMKPYSNKSGHYDFDKGHKKAARQFSKKLSKNDYVTILKPLNKKKGGKLEHIKKKFNVIPKNYYTFGKYIFKRGSKIVWDSSFVFDDKGVKISKEGWKYVKIKFICELENGDISFNCYDHRNYIFGSLKNVRPYDVNPRTEYGDYKSLEFSFDDAIEYFSFFTWEKMYNGVPKTAYLKFIKNYDKAKF